MAFVVGPSLGAMLVGYELKKKYSMKLGLVTRKLEILLPANKK